MRPDRQAHRNRSVLYFASPLFSVAERGFNETTATALESYFEVYLPQRDGGLMVEMIKEGVPAEAAAQRVFDTDLEAILRCDVLVAVLDGRAVDEGVAFELGLAYANRKRCVGLQTDVRRLVPSGNNPMVGQALSVVLASVEELVDWARRYCDEQLGGGSRSGLTFDGR